METIPLYRNGCGGPTLAIGPPQQMPQAKLANAVVIPEGESGLHVGGIIEHQLDLLHLYHLLSRMTERREFVPQPHPGVAFRD